MRTTEAPARPRGRPKGTKAARLKLDAREADIRFYLARGVSKRAICRIVECAPSTLYGWLARLNIRGQAPPPADI